MGTRSPPPPKKPELQEDFILVKKTRFIELEQKEAILDQMIKQFKEKGLKGGKGIQISEGGKGDDGKGDKEKGGGVIVVESTEEEAEMPTEDIQKPVAGDLKCDVCNIFYKSTLELRHHIKKFHKNVYLFKCDMCGKGFMSKESKKMHEKAHGDGDKEEVAYAGGYCKKCEKGFTWPKSYKKHMNAFHSKKKPLKCSTCPKTFRTKDDLDQHFVRCPTNPNKKQPFPCDICGKGKFYFPKELKAHKIKHHHWK